MHNVRRPLGQHDHGSTLPSDLDVELRPGGDYGMVLVERFDPVDPADVNSLPEVVHLGSVHAPLIVY